jgi:8-amino-3,8-dideoxy-alpha-D-manno-octulosonate transaminase
MKYLQEADFSQSDYYISRTLSVLIKLSWTEEEVHHRATTIKNTIASVLHS